MEPKLYRAALLLDRYYIDTVKQTNIIQTLIPSYIFFPIEAIYNSNFIAN